MDCNLWCSNQTNFVHYSFVREQKFQKCWVMATPVPFSLPQLYVYFLRTGYRFILPGPGAKQQQSMYPSLFCGWEKVWKRHVLSTSVACFGILCRLRVRTRVTVLIGINLPLSRIHFFSLCFSNYLMCNLIPMKLFQRRAVYRFKKFNIA